MSRADLVSVWSRGWARARGIRAVENIPGGFRFDVGRPGHRVRYVLHTWEPAYLREIGRHIVTPGTWLKIDAARTTCARRWGRSGACSRRTI